jgi:hypothetical protein
MVEVAHLVADAGGALCFVFGIGRANPPISPRVEADLSADLNEMVPMRNHFREQVGASPAFCGLASIAAVPHYGS